MIEVGLGGRFDATNVITPSAGAITTIGFDHQQHLGDTLAADRVREGRHHQAGRCRSSSARCRRGARGRRQRVAAERGATLDRGRAGVDVDGARSTDGRARMTIDDAGRHATAR